MIWIIIIAASIFIVGQTIVEAEHRFAERQAKIERIGRK